MSPIWCPVGFAEWVTVLLGVWVLLGKAVGGLFGVG